MLKRIRLSLLVAGAANVAGACGGAEAPLLPADGVVRSSEAKALATDATQWTQGASTLTMRMRHSDDPATNTWTLVGDMLHPRYLHSATLLETGDVLVTGGVSRQSLIWYTERYTP